MVKPRMNKLFHKAVFGTGLLFGALLFFAGDAAAGIINPMPLVGSCTSATLGMVLCNIVIYSQMIPGLITGIAYLIGLIFGVQGVFKLKDHVLYPDRVPIWDAVKRFGAGGALFALPIVLESLYNTIVGTGGSVIGSYNYSGFNGGTSGGGLDTIVAALVKDLWQPMHVLIAGFAYLAGLIFTVVGITRLVRTAQDGPRGPGGFGTLMTFATAGVCFSLDRLMGAFSTTMFGNSNVATFGIMSGAITTGMTPAEIAHTHAVISAVLGFVALVGWISFVRGWFIIRDVAEGNQQASMMAGVTHILGGALAVNLGPLLNAVQTTFGVNLVGITFA